MSNPEDRIAQLEDLQLFDRTVDPEAERKWVTTVSAVNTQLSTIQLSLRGKAQKDRTVLLFPNQATLNADADYVYGPVPRRHRILTATAICSDNAGGGTVAVRWSMAGTVATGVAATGATVVGINTVTTLPVLTPGNTVDAGATYSLDQATNNMTNVRVCLEIEILE